jgi:hypothetical protein
MFRKSIVHKSIRTSDRSITRTIDVKGDNSVLVLTEDARTQYTIPKHIVDKFDRHELLFKSGEDGTKKVQRGP